MASVFSERRATVADKTKETVFVPRLSESV